MLSTGFRTRSNFSIENCTRIGAQHSDSLEDRLVLAVFRGSKHRMLDALASQRPAIAGKRNQTQESAQPRDSCSSCHCEVLRILQGLVFGRGVWRTRRTILVRAFAAYVSAGVRETLLVDCIPKVVLNPEQTAELQYECDVLIALPIARGPGSAIRFVSTGHGAARQ
eukprot:2260660-Rhodomonas_salina.5